jgi:hypothetical protein
MNDGNIFLNHNCDIDPDVASIITLQLSDLFNRKKFFIDEMFTYKENGDIVFGEEAMKIQDDEFEKEVQRRKYYDYIMYSDIGIEV